MSQPYVGEIRMFGGNFAPLGWAFCNGALMSIAENETLFNLIGTTYGGDGQETFAVPDLRGRIPIHMGTGQTGTTYQIGEAAGVEMVTLTSQQTPTHTHALTVANTTSNSPNPSNNLIGLSSKIQMFYADVPSTQMKSNALTPVGGSQPHENMMPYLCVNFIISLYGIYPQQS